MENIFAHYMVLELRSKQKLKKMTQTECQKGKFLQVQNLLIFL